MTNAYDFDKTIYDGDSTIDFYLYCLKKKKSIIFLLPIQIYAFILYILKIKDKEFFKEKFFIFVQKIPNIDLYIKKFWDHNIEKIKPWYLKQKKSSDIIISASPEFLLNPLTKSLKIDMVIATKVNKKTGKFESKNCYGKEKVKRLQQEKKKLKVEKFYTDSISSDKPMLDYAMEGFVVKKNKIERYK